MLVEVLTFLTLMVNLFVPSWAVSLALAFSDESEFPFESVIMVGKFVQGEVSENQVEVVSL